MMPSCVELFAGAGGAALGLEAAGISHLACVEYDADACATLRAAGLPCVEGDVRDPDLYESEWVGCDLLWASFPCQAWSTAGKREGAKDERNGWPWTVDAIDCLEPEWFAAENVTGLLTHRGGCASRCLGPEECPRAYFDNVILSQLRERFAWVGFRVLNASSFGVPQHRRRVIIVAGPHAIEWPEPTHGKPTGQGDLFGRSLSPWVTIGQALGLDGSIRQGVVGDGDYYGTDVPTTNPAPTILVGSPIRFDPGTESAVRVIGGGRNPQSAATAHLRSYRDLTDEPCTTVAAEQIGNAGPWVIATSNGLHSLEKPSTTISAGGGAHTYIGPGQPGRHERTQAGYEREWWAGRRRLTVEECATLQGFPAGHPFQGNKSSQYRQVGNAVPPKLAEVVGRAVSEAAK